MKKVRTITEFKKALKESPHKDIIAVVCRLCRSGERNKQILNTIFSGARIALEIMEKNDGCIIDIIG